MTKADMAAGEMGTALVPVSGYRQGPRNRVPEEMVERGLALLRERRVMPVEEFDRELAPLAGKVDPTDTTGSGRNRRKNLVDHLKAQLTKKGLIQYAEIRRVEHVIWWPPAGAVYDRVVMDEEDARETLRCLVRLANG